MELSEIFTLRDGILLTNDHSPIIQFQIVFDDINMIKNLTSLATGRENTFISITNMTISDTNYNIVVERDRSEALQVANFTEDTISPRLRQFDLDMDSGVLTLRFSETVLSDTLEVTGITLTSPSSSHQLTNVSSTLSPDGPTIIVQIGESDLNRIKQLEFLAVNESTTFLEMTAITINDTSSNPVVEIEASSPTNVTTFTTDSTDPVLESFRIHMDNYLPPLQIILTFSETVRASTVDPEMLELRVSPNASNGYTLTGGNITTLDSTEITITVTDFDLEQIRLLERQPLGFYANTTFISLTTSFVSDMAFTPNQIEEITFPALVADSNTADLIPPELAEFTLNMNQGRIILTFSEPIIVSTFNISLLLLQNDEMLPDQMLAIPNSNISETPNSREVGVMIDQDELNELKRLLMLATSINDTYIAVQANIIEDLAGNDALEAIVPATRYRRDRNRPSLWSFDFNCRSRLLVLYFSETIDASSFDPQSVTFVSDPSDPNLQVYTLTSGTVLTDDNTTLTLQVTNDDKNAIKQLIRLVTSNETTYLSITSTAVEDTSGNQVMAIPISLALPVSMFVADADRPILLSWDLDMNTGTFILHFNETVNVSTINLDQFVLQDGREYMMTNYTIQYSSPQTVNSPNITILLNPNDLNEIKRLQFCYNESVCYLRYDDGAVQDMVGQDIAGVFDGNATQVDRFMRDEMPPTLVSFSFIDVQEGLLALSFSETINASSLNFTAITIQETYNNPLYSLPLRGGFTTDEDGTEISFILVDRDRLSLAASDRLCTYHGDCYISFTSDLVTDMVSIPITASSEMPFGYQVESYGEDNTPPALVNFTIYMDNSSLVLTFNESVSITSFDPTGITIQGEASTNVTELMYTLSSDSYTTSSNGHVIIVMLDKVDVDALKASSFAKNENDTFISILNTTITDTTFRPAPNPVIEISTENALPVYAYFGDTTSPLLQAYTLDLDADMLILIFDEPIQIDSINCSEIDIHSSNIPNATLISLTGCDYLVPTSNVGSLEVKLNLTFDDLVEIKQDTTIATERSNTYLSFSSEAFTDTAGRPVEPVLFSQVTTYIPDLTRPSLINFTLDLHLGVMNFTFNDVVLSSSFNATALTLQHSEQSRQGLRFTPSRFSVTGSNNGYLITLQLDHFDLLRLKETAGLAETRNNTYLTMRADLVDDTGLVDVVPITDGKAIQVAEFIPDDVPPELANFTLDLDEGELILTFTDTVNLATLNLTLLSLQSASNISEAESFLPLRGGNASRSHDALSVTIKLDTDDLNELKRDLQLGTDQLDTFLAMEGGTIYDLGQPNPVVGIGEDVAEQATTVIPDETSPILLAYTLDMNSGQLCLTFDETVNAESLVITEIILQNSSNNGESYQLVSSTNSTTENSTQVKIFLDQEDINAINRRRTLATETETTFIVFSELLVRDMNGNNIRSINTSNGLMATQLYPDVTRPNLLLFEFNLNDALLTLYFDEVMDAVTLDPTQLTFQNSENGSTSLYQLSNGTVALIDDTILLLSLSREDLNEIKRLYQLATSLNDTYLSITEFTVNDTFSNRVESVPSVMALQARNYTSDTSPPILQIFDFDLNSGTISLTFDETVNASSFDVVLTIVTNLDGQEVILSTSSSSENFSTTVFLTVSQDDLDSIRIRTALALDSNTTFISLLTNAVLDMSSVGIQNTTIMADSFTPDIMAPELISFVFDLNLGMIQLTFSEAVNTSSLNITQFTLFSDSNSSLSNYMLTVSSQTFSSDARVFNLTLGDEDLNAIKADLQLAVSNVTTYLFLEDDAILDMSGNPVEAMDVPLQASTYVPDGTSPQLRNVTIDMNEGLVTLQFSETIDNSTFEPTTLVFLNDPNSLSGFSPSGGNFISLGFTTIQLNLTEDDVNLIKQDDFLFVSMDTSFISVSNETLTDTNGNQLVPSISDTTDLIYIADTTPPEVTGFNLDMDEGLLTLSFSEAVRMVDITEFWLQSSATDPDLQYRFTVEDDSVSSRFATEVNLTLSSEDLDAIKLMEGLAMDQNNTFLRWNSSGVNDFSGLELELLNVSLNEGLPVTIFESDETDPQLLSYTLDLNSMYLLTLTFDEPVRSSSVVLSNITLQASDNSSGLTESDIFTLTNGTVTPEDGRVVSIELAFLDVVEIQTRVNLATRENNTFIVLQSGALLDMNFNPSSEVS